MSLKDYQEKRDFSKTKEPKGNIKTSKKNRKYIIQKHHATNLHYDLRIEMSGVLRSWAIPKGPPSEPNVKRLAIQTEDHPIEYVNFEGEIPKGEYGAGNVEIWDKGTYKPLEVDEQKIIISIEGVRLRGTYCLIKINPRKDLKNWLFFKKKDSSR